MNKILKFFKSQPVLLAAFFAAAVTLFFVPPDKAYLDYCNRTVLIQLFCLMTAVGGFRSIGVFERAAGLLLEKAGNLRRLGMIFTLICFFSSMLVTNDVALITFVPLTLLVYSDIKDERSRIITVVLETAAANLGSMVTPFGNPQNLYIYDHYRLSIGEFFNTMLPTAALSLVLLILLCMTIPRSPCRMEKKADIKFPKTSMSAFAILFALCLLTVFRVVPDYVCLAAAIITALIFDRSLLLKIDYGLLGTFICFFVFVGNIARIEPISRVISEAVTGREVMSAALISQVISNVPAAVMLSGFTDKGRELLLGVNIGGLGTLIASLASLISFQYYRKSEGSKTWRYMGIFTAVNFGMLLVLTAVALWQF